MKKLSDYLVESLLLTQPSLFKREFELRSSTELIAKMGFPKFFSTTALVEGFESIYEIKTLSFWGSDVGIFKQSYELPFAKYTTENFWGTKGVIELPRGEKLKLKFGAFKKSCEIFSSSDELLVRFQSKVSIKDKNVITIKQRSELLDNHPWIIILAFYKTLQRNRNSAAAAG